jgi:3-(3-hydroxy-phenyl)propionate hydroxylase
MTTPTHDVLIVGLGPTGAVLAGLLAQAGIRVLAVDRDADLFPDPRAAHFDGEIMQVFQRLGIAEAAEGLSRGIPEYEFRNGAGATLMRFENRPPMGSRWRASYMFHQPALETALRQAISALPGMDIALSTRLTAITANGPAGVTAQLEGPEGPRTVTARYLVGCDGGSSPIRAMIGGGLSDYGFDEPWLVVDCTATDEDGLPQHGLQVCDPARPTTVMPMSPLRRRWEFMLLPGETPETALADGFVESLLKPWGRRGQLTVVRKAVYRFHGLVARQWRSGNVLLAGDAAHQMPPFLGQGMCSGIRDAVSLAWKLEWVLKARAPEALLDTYQTEREPHVRAIIETAIAMGKMVCMLDPAIAALRDQAMAAGAPPPPIAPPAAGPGVFAKGEPGAYVACLAETQPDGRFTLATLAADPPAHLPDGFAHQPLSPDTPAARWLTARGAEAALLRPDGYLFGAGHPAALLAAAETALSAPAKA